MTKTLAETIVSEIADLIETDRGLVMSRAAERVEMVLSRQADKTEAGSTSNSALTTDHIRAAHKAMELNEAEMQRLRDENLYVYAGNGKYYSVDKDGNFVVDKQ